MINCHGGPELTNASLTFAIENQDNLDPDIGPLGLTAAEKDALAAFLKALTDRRVRHEEAPFDQPSISVPNGGSDVVSTMFNVAMMDDRVELPAVGAAGHPTPLGTDSSPFANFLQLFKSP